MKRIYLPVIGSQWIWPVTSFTRYSIRIKQVHNEVDMVSNNFSVLQNSSCTRFL